MSKIKVPINRQEQLELEEKANEQDTVVDSAFPNDTDAASFSADESELAIASNATDDRDDQIRKLTLERDAVIDRMARMQAEFDNARKRAAREQADFRDFAVTDAVNQLIPVLDNFDLAVRNAATASADDLRKGIELIRKQLEANLEKLGVVAVIPDGQPFDPRFHEAIEMVETAEAIDNTVISVLQRGYKLKERLLRPAMVRVARNPNH